MIAATTADDGIPGCGASRRRYGRSGDDMGFVPFVIGTCVVLYVLTLLASGGNIGMGGLFSFLSPSRPSLFLFGASGGVPVFGYGRWWTVLSARGCTAA